MSSPASSLPDAWVQRIWATMRSTYGAAFDRMWATPAGADPAQHAKATIAHWAKELGRFQSNPQALAYALDNLPPNPPNLIEFKALCNRRPEPKAQALPAPKPDPQRVQQVIAGIARTTEPKDPLSWARRLHHLDTHNGGRMEDGRPITLAQRQTYRQALRLDHQESTHA